MTSSNGNIFRVTGPLCGEFTGPGEFPTQRPVTRSFDVFFDLRLNIRFSKQPWGWWFETPSWSLWRQCNGLYRFPFVCEMNSTQFLIYMSHHLYLCYDLKCFHKAITERLNDQYHQSTNSSLRSSSNFHTLSALKIMYIYRIIYHVFRILISA